MSNITKEWINAYDEGLKKKLSEIDSEITSIQEDVGLLNEVTVEYINSLT